MSEMIKIKKEKTELAKDFQEWAKCQNYVWSGACDVWIASYEEYFKEMEKLKKDILSLRQILKSHSDTVIANASLREQLHGARELIDFLEGSNRL